MFVEQPEKPGRIGIKIEGPPSERMSPVYYLLVLVSFVLVGFTVWLLALEWARMPLPVSLRLAVGS